MDTDVRLFALLSDQGTAMSETALTEKDMTNPTYVQNALDAAQVSGDWDGNREFTDVTGNEAIWEMFFGQDED